MNSKDKDSMENIILKINDVNICFSSLNQSYDLNDINKILEENNWDLDYFPKRDTIFKQNGLFYIISRSDNQLNVNYIFDNYADALSNLNRGVIDLGTFNLERQGKYIYNSKSKFTLVKQNHNKTTNFGSFKSVKEANIAKLILEYYNWDIAAINKAIFKINSTYYTIAIIDENILILNESNSLTKARYEKDDVVDRALEDFKIKQQNANIYKQSKHRYIIQKSIKNKTIRYGFAFTLPGALALKELVIENNWDMDAIDDYTYVYDGEFYFVFFKHDRQLYVLGRFKNIEDSFLLERNLNKKYMVSHRDQLSTNIYGLHAKFVVSRFEDGDDRVYGYYPSYDEAVFVRELLKENDWDIDYFIDNNIFKKDDEYVVLVKLDDKVRLLSTYDKYEDAADHLDYVIEDFKVNKSRNRKAKYIYKVKNKYMIQKFHKGKMRVFGRFETFEDAVTIKKLLTKLNWDISKINDEDNIFKIQDKFAVILEDNGQLHLLGIFPTYQEALKNKGNLLFEKVSYLNSSSNQYSKKNKNIQKTSRGFNVSKRINGELVTFGTYDTHDEAVAARDKFIDDNWKVPEKPTQQADDLNSIIFNLTGWQKVVFDAIESLNKETFELDELRQFKSSFMRFAPPGKAEKKVIKNIEDLVNLNLLEKIDEKTYKKLWMY